MEEIAIFYFWLKFSIFSSGGDNPCVVCLCVCVCGQLKVTSVAKDTLFLSLLINSARVRKILCFIQFIAIFSGKSRKSPHFNVTGGYIYRSCILVLTLALSFRCNHNHPSVHTRTKPNILVQAVNKSLRSIKYFWDRNDVFASFFFFNMHPMPFLRSLPVDSPAAGPHQTLNSGPCCGGGFGGPHLDRTAIGRHQQRRKLRSHEGLRAKQAGQCPVCALSGQTLTGWARATERGAHKGCSGAQTKKITLQHILHLSHAGQFWCSLIRGQSESGGHCWSRRGKQRAFLALLKGAESLAALCSARHESLT